MTLAQEKTYTTHSPAIEDTAAFKGPVSLRVAIPSADYVVETSKLTKRYGDGKVVAVDHLDLRIPRGGVFGFLGPNGSGKTTTMGMLLGLVKPSSGSALIFGERAGKQESLRRIGAMVETPTFYPYLTGRANLRYFQAIGHRGVPADVDRLLDLVDLRKRADHKFSTYSLGMKQRLGIACAMLGDPELVFLDEPTNGLDPAGVVEVRELIRDLGETGRTVVLSSHLLAETELVCDNVAVLSHGRLLAQGSIGELLQQHHTLRLRTTNNDQARSALSTLPWVEAVTRDDGFLVVTAAQDRSWEITRMLARSQIYVGELTPVHRSLEEYFMDLTGTDPATGRERS